MENIPFYVSLVFVAATLLTLFFFYKATRSRLLTGMAIAWMAIQSIPGIAGFYTATDSVPPRFLLLIAPPLIGIVLLFALPAGRKLVAGFDQKWLTWLSVVRIPVEIVLLWLFLHQTIPQLMTFEGRNFDVLSGLTAPLIAYYGYHQRRLSRGILLAWNFICLGLLLNIVINAVLAAPFPFQQFAFDQPNIAVLYFPFIWLPCFIVPAVLLSHLVNISKLISKERYELRTTKYEGVHAH
jgi:hypothetical protein